SDASELLSIIGEATERGELRRDAGENIRRFLKDETSEFYLRVVGELAADGHWPELNDRFYKTLAFGTGGLRGRTIGKIVTRAERSNASERERPEFPCVGTNAMNFFNISRATWGLVAYLRDWNRREKISAKLKIVI